MPFQTGTALSPSDLMNQINTFITGEGWTNLRGETDMVPASPKSARYWRIVMSDIVSASNFTYQLQNVELRGTLGGANLATTGANWIASSESLSFPVSNLASGDSNYWQTTATRSTIVWAYYDFGSATVIREAAVQCNNDQQAPENLWLQWSNDAVTWCTMYSSLSDFSWVDDEEKIYQFDDAYVDSQHPSSTIKRTSGYQAMSAFTEQQTPDRQINDDFFVWQGPGFDASRRVYVAMGSSYNLTTGSQFLGLFGMTDYDPEILDMRTQENGSFNFKALTFNSASVDYWLYVNDIRIIIIVKSGVQDYTSAYIGFGGTFALPSQWSFPLVLAGTSRVNYDGDGYPIYIEYGSSDNAQSSCCDPGDSAAQYLRWDNAWVEIQNRSIGADQDEPFISAAANVWPWHTSSTGDGDFPACTLPDQSGDSSTHWLDAMDATVQSDLPFFPAQIIANQYGNLMTMDGIYAVPNPGVLSPEQVVTDDAQDYRVFSNRARSGGNHFFLVRED